MSDYNIGALMKEIFLADWFYDKKNMGDTLNRPIGLLVNVSRLLNVEYGNEDTLVFIQKLLGQTLFMPPNVAGWPMGKRSIAWQPYGHSDAMANVDAYRRDCGWFSASSGSRKATDHPLCLRIRAIASSQLKFANARS